MPSAFMKWRSLRESAPEPVTRPLYEIYAERRELISRYVPAEIQAAHARVVGELKQTGVEQRALRTGDSAPEFELSDQNGSLVRSTDLLSRGSLVVCFIRGRWCPFCVAQMEAMNAKVPEFEQLGTSFVAISPQNVHQSFLMADQHKLGFPLLSDSGNRISRQFGLVYPVPGYQQEVYRRAFVNLPFINGDSAWELPIPATFVMIGSAAGDQGRRILFASANADYTERPEPGDLLSRIGQLLP